MRKALVVALLAAADPHGAALAQADAPRPAPAEAAQPAAPAPEAEAEPALESAPAAEPVLQPLPREEPQKRVTEPSPAPAPLSAPAPLPTPAPPLAQAAPRLAKDQNPWTAEFDLFAEPSAPLSPKEKQGVSYGEQWAANRDGPARGADGGAVYVFGATLPSVVCAPLYVCDLALEPGETVKSINVGDSVRWRIEPAEQGSGEAAVTHIAIKPVDAGLMTNMMITTDRRAYVVKLVSSDREWTPRVSFAYPEDAEGRWRAYRAQRAREEEARAAAPAAASPAALNFRYRLSGDRPPWRPVRVYDDGVKTFIQFPPETAHGELPALVALDDPGFLGLDELFNGPKTQLVNYRLVGDRFVVDKVLNRAALISGVGLDQTSVEIVRERRN